MGRNFSRIVLRPRFCVIGAGHGGVAMAGHLSIMGYKVNLWNRSAERIDAIRDIGSIALEGLIEGIGKPYLATAEIGEAIEGVDVVMVAIPAHGHLDVARLLAPHLRPGQTVVLNPGRTGGALEVRNVFRLAGLSPEVTVAEAQTFLYICRLLDPARAKIFGIKDRVPLASLPAHRTLDVIGMLGGVFPQYVADPTVLETSYNNVATAFHPPVTILNSGWIESEHDFEYYHQGISPSVARILEYGVDAERQAVAAAVGVPSYSTKEWLNRAYNSQGKSLYEAVQATKGYSGLPAPNFMAHRYLLEDVPTSLVPLSETGAQYGVPTPTIDAFIHLASLMLGRDFRTEGRTLDRMGIRGMSVTQLRQAVTTG